MLCMTDTSTISEQRSVIWKESAYVILTWCQQENSILKYRSKMLTASHVPWLCDTATGLFIQSTISVFLETWFNVNLSLLCFIRAIRKFRLEFSLLRPENDNDDDGDDEDVLKKAITRKHHMEFN